MKYLVENIIRESHYCPRVYSSHLFHPGKELHAITTTPAPNPAIWAFSKENNFLQVGQYSKDDSDKIPTAWVHKGKEEILSALHG